MIYNVFIKHFLFPLYFKKNNNSMLDRLDDLERTQWLPREEIEKLQFERLKRLLIHSYNNVDFYRERFDSVGFNPEDFTNLKEFKKIPYLTKSDLQVYFKSLIAKNIKHTDLIHDASGGSTGKPTKYFKDLRRQQERAADKIRHDRWCGWDLGEKSVLLWGAQREFEKQPSLKDRLVEKYIYRSYGFNAFDVTEEKVLVFLEKLKKIRPTMILAYANVAYLFAKVIHDHNIDMGGLKLKGVISSAETLTEEKREAIESAFKCKVLNRYGSREVGLVSSECAKQEGLHVNMESVVLEIEKGGEGVDSGELGEVIVTDLWNYGMPFIRYQMGDVGVMSDHICSCGRQLPLMKSVEGRTGDFFVDSKGGLVHGEYFTHLFYGVEGVSQFQFVQEKQDLIILKIVPNEEFSDAVLEPIYEKIRLCMGDGVKVKTEILTTSLIEDSGKFRFTISKLSGKYFNI